MKIIFYYMRIGYKQLEEASTHTSAETHAGIFCDS